MIRGEPSNTFLLAAAFGMAFSVLLVVPLWALFGRLLPEEEPGGEPVSPSAFREAVQAQQARYGLPDGSVRPPPGDVYLSTDVVHGFSPVTTWC